jgi:hypothetical protein
VLTQCPPTESTGSPCSGSFRCDYPGSCGACGCCYGSTQCRDGAIVYLGFNDACVQCPSAGAGGQGFGGSGGGASGGSGGGAPDLSACAAPSPCPEVTEQLGELVLPPTDAALRCVIEALRARTPGKYLQSLAIATGIGPPSATTTVHLVKADGTVHRIARSASGTSNPAVCSLPPAADFEACVESVSTDTWATPECRSAAWVTGCVAGAVDCD